MKNTKRLTAILTTAVLISLIATSLTANAWINNKSAEDQQVTTNNTYMSESSSAYAAAAKYGDLVNADYEWHQFIGNTIGNTGFAGGPAPDRYDIVWSSDNVINYTTPNGAQLTFSGKLFQTATGLLANGSSRPMMVAVNPFTGALLWKTPLVYGPGSATNSFQIPFGGTCMYYVDENHLCALTTNGLVMYRASDGAYLWIDAQINPSAAYHRAYYDEDYKMFVGVQASGPNLNGSQTFDQNVWGANYYTEFGWTLADPDVDKGFGGRIVWSTPRIGAGNPMEGVGGGKAFMGSYSSAIVYALNITTGELLWKTQRPDAAGYAGTYSVENDILVTGCQSQSVIAYNGTTGEVLWWNKEGTGRRAFNVWNGLIAYNRTYWHDLGSGTDGATKCFDLFTGKELWAVATLELIGYYQTVVADGKIYGMQSDKSTTTGRDSWPQRFSCWDAFTGQEIWSISPESAIAWPTVAYGCLFYTVGGITFCVSTATKPADWAMWRGNVDNPGVSSSTGPRDISGGPKWTFGTGNAISSSPVVSNGKMYIGSGDGYIYCLNAYNGSLIWRFKLADTTPQMTIFGSTVAVSDGKVIVGPDDGNIYGLDADTGAKLWTVPTGTYRQLHTGSGQFQTRSSPIIYQGKIYVASCFSNKTYCLDMSGNILWSFQCPDFIFGSVAIENSAIYFMDSAGGYRQVSNTEGYSGKVYKLDMSGNLLLNFSIRTDFRGGTYDTVYPSMATPVVFGDKIFVGVNNAYVECYNATNGAVIFAQEMPYVLGERSQGSPVYVPQGFLRGYNGTTTFNNVGGYVICQAGPTMVMARGDNGSKIWSAWGGWEIFSSPIICGRDASALIYSGSESYGMTVWNASNGQPISWFTTQGGLVGSCAIWDGKLYFGSTDSRVYCFEDHPEQPTAISISVDKTSVDLNSTESVTVTATLTSVSQQVDYLVYGPVRGSPGIAGATAKVTFTGPDNVEQTLLTTTDAAGQATWTFTPNQAGTWKILTWYDGQERSTSGISYAFSDQQTVEAAYTITQPDNTDGGNTSTSIPMEYVYAAIIVIVIVIVAAAALMLLRKRKPA